MNSPMVRIYTCFIIQFTIGIELNWTRFLHFLFQCPIEWFHFGCVGLTAKPKGKWYCPRCTEDRKKKWLWSALFVFIMWILRFLKLLLLLPHVDKSHQMRLLLLLEWLFWLSCDIPFIIFLDFFSVWQILKFEPKSGFRNLLFPNLPQKIFFVCPWIVTICFPNFFLAYVNIIMCLYF